MKEKLIYGSTAMKHWYPEFREPRDIDYIDKNLQFSTREEERHWMPEFQILLDKNKDDEFLDPELLLACKMAHCNWNIHWGKTITDILFLKNKGHKINVPVYKELVKGFRKVHGKESAPLAGKDKETFFQDAVKRKYVHDDIHEAVAYYDRPLFERILVNSESGSVMCSEDKFNELSHEDKIKMCKEEIFVTALERYIIPTNFKKNRGAAYALSLQKFVTTMSSGWMALFLIDNFEDLIYDKFDYVEVFKKNEHKCRLND